MKKDQKYLLKLEECLSKINKKKRDNIILKYRKLIDDEKANNKRIVDILKTLGDPTEVAQKEIEELKHKPKKIKKEKEVKNKNTESFITKLIKKIKENKLNKKTDDKKKKTKEKEKKKIVKKKTNDNKFKFSFKKENKTKKKDKKTKKSANKIKFSFKNLFKKKSKVEKAVEEIKNESEKIIEKTLETVTENKLFETKAQKTKRIILKVLGILFILICLFIFLWAVVILIASLFAVLDGLKIYGIVLALLGIMLLTLWFLLLTYLLIYKKRIIKKYFLISIILIIALIGVGIGYTFKQYYSIKTVKDVSEKYTMALFHQKYNLPSKDRKLYITFNSNYKTKHIVEYDDTLDDKIKVEVKYYEAYYDFYIKRTTNNIYVSLKLDQRDRLSVYINDLKEGKVFDSDELSRYTVKITMNEKDKDKVVIN